MLEALELDQPRVVTVADLDRLASKHAIGLDGTELAYELRRRGWTSTLRTRGAWSSCRVLEPVASERVIATSSCEPR